ncbi:MAG: 30S ribosomal protein S16 [Candidatus Latescibacterota bacterium]
MAVKLRMKRMGSHKRPFYRIVAADTRCQRDGRFLEIVGYYDPMVKPYKFVVDREKVNTWLRNGAQMSETVEGLLRREGIVQEYNLGKANARKKTEEVPSPAGEGA